MSDRKYRPGTRRADLLRKSDAQMSPNRFAWVRGIFGQLVIMVHPTVEEDDFDVQIFHPVPRTKGVYFDLTSMTSEELDAFEKIISTAIGWARPIVKERDRRAQDALDRGDDSYPRVYRPVPQLIFRKGNERADWEELRQRFDGTPEVEGVLNDPNAGLPPRGGDVPERDAGPDEREDDGA